MTVVVIAAVLVQVLQHGRPDPPWVLHRGAGGAHRRALVHRRRRRRLRHRGSQGPAPPLPACRRSRSRCRSSSSRRSSDSVVAFTQWDLGGMSGAGRSMVWTISGGWLRTISSGTLLGNNFKYVLVAVPLQYVVAFVIALLLNQAVQGPEVLPCRVSVAVHDQSGCRRLDGRPLDPRCEPRRRAEGSGSALASTTSRSSISRIPAFLGIVAMDSWIAIPFMMVHASGGPAGTADRGVRSGPNRRRRSPGSGSGTSPFP